MTMNRATKQTISRRLRSERGVSLIHVGLIIFVITGFSAFVFDHGVLMVGRSQAQNVADAAALAGVITRIKDEPGDTSGTIPAVNGITEKVIQKTVESHVIFGGDGADTGWTRTWNCPTGITGWCVQVNVFRDGVNAGSTALPVFFATLFNIDSQKTQATATAVAKDANGTNCLKPFLIPDKWQNAASPAFDPDEGDVYRPWTDANPTGYSQLDFNQTTVVLKPGSPANTISPSDFYEINEFGETGGKTYETAIINCEISKKIGDTVELFPGSTVGPTIQGVDALLDAADGEAEVIVGMFDPAVFEAQRRESGRIILQIVNMLTVRIVRTQGSNIEGLIVGGVGEDMGPGTIPTPSGAASLIKVVQLVR
jgi:hypothetical protein